MHTHSLGQVSVGTSDVLGESSHEHPTPPASHVPLFSNEQSSTCSMTPSRTDVSAHSNDQCTPEHAEHVHGVDEETIFASVEAAFPKSSHVKAWEHYMLHFWWKRIWFL